MEWHTFVLCSYGQAIIFAISTSSGLSDFFGKILYKIDIADIRKKYFSVGVFPLVSTDKSFMMMYYLAKGEKMENTAVKTWTTPDLLQSFWFIASFTFISGYVNSYSFLMRGGVFAINQTGNAGIFVIAVFYRDIPLLLNALWPMLATMAGAFIAEHLFDRYSNHPEGTWQMRVLYWEIPVFFVVGLIPLTVPYAIPNVTLSLVAGFQLSAFRTYKGWIFNSTIQTGNLRSMGQYLYKAMFVEKKKAFSKKTFGFFMLFALFIIGGIVGAFASDWLGVRSIWGAIPILLALAAAHRRLCGQSPKKQESV